MVSFSCVIGKKIPDADINVGKGSESRMSFSNRAQLLDTGVHAPGCEVLLECTRIHEYIITIMSVFNCRTYPILARCRQKWSDAEVNVGKGKK